MENRIKNLEDKVELLEKKIEFLISSKVLEKNVHIQNQKTTHIIKESNLPKKESNKSLLPILGVICFLMSGIFLVKLAVESGWLNPLRQWLMLLMFGFALGIIAYTFEKIEKSYRTYLGASCVVILFLAVFSGSLYFSLYNEFVTIILASIVAFIGLYFNQYFQNEMFSILSIIGTYLSPILLGRNYDLTFLSIFYLIWAALFARIGAYLKSRTVVLVASYLALGTFVGLNYQSANSEMLVYIILVQSMQFMIFAHGVLYYSIKNHSHLSKTESFAYFPILMFFYGTMYFLLNLYNPLIAPYVSFGFGIFLFLLYLIGKKHIENLQSGDMVKAFLGVIIFHSGYLEILPVASRPWLLPIILLGQAIAKQKNQILSPFLNFVFTAISFIEFTKLCASLLLDDSSYLTLVPAIFTTVVGIYSFLMDKKTENSLKLFLYLFHILNIMTLYRLMYDFGSLMVTVGWAAYSILILGYSFKKKNVLLAKSSLLVFAVTALKALLYDVSMAPSVVRIISLMLTGLVLYGAGYFFRIIGTWELEKN